MLFLKFNFRYFKLFYFKKDTLHPSPHTSPNLSLSRRGEASPSHSPEGEGENQNRE
ncbi:MAG: hypothetical protein LBQ59_00865 [Candidatus Peribacteria bacterium]|nr:hypothetical protein [Candidatus Peribacteria bacterium]